MMTRPGDGRDAGGPAFVTRAFVIAVAFTVLLSPHYSWYFVWLVPFLPLAPPRVVVPVACLTATCFFLYRSWLGDGPAETFVTGSMVYLPFFALCACAWLWARLRRKGAAASYAE
jgi:hypothetical protein